MSRMRIAIVGGGVIGMALAWRLADRAHVTVVDAGAASPAATRAAAGMLAPSFERSAGPLAEDLYRFGCMSLTRWREFAPALERASGAPIDYRPFGIIGVALAESDAALLGDAAADLVARGAAVEPLTGGEARALEPSLSAEVISGFLARDDAQVDPRLALEALKTAFLRGGGAIIERRALRLATTAGKASGLFLSDGALLEADAVIAASGAFAGAVASAPVHPVKGEAMALAAPGVLRRVVRGPGAYLCPKADGRLVIGATETAGDATLEPTAQGIAALRRGAERLANGLAAAPETERWAGLRPGTPDGAPILGAPDEGPEGLFLALGHYRNGILLAPETAALLADAVLEGSAPSALAPFSPDRFAAAAVL